MRNTKNVVPITSTPATRKTRKQKQKDEERFRKYVGAPDARGCRCYLGGIAINGYGMFSVGGKTVYAHRYAWELDRKQAIPANHVIRHKCDNRACVEPTHLLCGTSAENSADMVQRGRSTKGRPLPRNPLTTQEIEKLVALSASGASNYRIARELGRSMPGVAYALKVHRSAIDLKRIRLQFADALQALNDHLAPSIAELQKITKKAA